MDYELIPTGYAVADKDKGNVIGYVDDQGDGVFRGWVINRLNRRFRVGDFASKEGAAHEVYGRYLGINALKA